MFYFIFLNEKSIYLKRKMAEKKKDKGEEDPRLEFIISYLLKSLRLKSDKWQKLMGTEDNRVSIFFFFLL